MNLLSRLLLIAAAVLATPAVADPTSQQLAAAKEAEARGAEIYAYDQAAWHSTDQFQIDLKKAKLSLEQVSEQGLRGYVVEPAEKGLLLVTYYGQKDGRTWAFARYWIAGSSVRRGGLVKPDEDAALSPLALKLVELRGKALQAAVADKAFLCTKGTPNTVVLPPRSDGSFPAYVMSSSIEQGVFPAGGHYRYVFNNEGKLLSGRPFSKSCVNLDYNPQNGKTPEAMVVSHLLDPQPTEIHVFVSYNLPVPLYVSTAENKGIWSIERGEIRSVKSDQ